MRNGHACWSGIALIRNCSHNGTADAQLSPRGRMMPKLRNTAMKNPGAIAANLQTSVRIVMSF